MKSKTRHEVGSFLGPHRHELIERFELTSGTGYPRYMGLFICSFVGNGLKIVLGILLEGTPNLVVV